MVITKGATAALVSHIITFTDHVDEEGKSVVITGWNRRHLRPILSLREKIKGVTEFAVVPKALKAEDVKDEHVKWVKATEYKQNEANYPVGDRQLDEEIELTEAEIEAVQFYAKQRKEFPNTTLEALDELDKIINYAKT